MRSLEKDLERYSKFLSSKRDQTIEKYDRLVRKGKIVIVEQDSLPKDTLRNVIIRNLKDYRPISEKQIVHKRARFLNWNKMRDSGEIKDDELNSNGIILFYYARAVAPHVSTYDLFGEISIADYLLYSKFALFAQLAANRLVIADESRYILSKWNRQQYKYPILQSPVDDQEISAIKQKYSIQHSREYSVKYCDDMDWLKSKNNIEDQILDVARNIDQNHPNYEIVSKRVKRWVSEPELIDLLTRYLIAAQSLVLGQLREIPDGYIHITITGKRDKNRYELQTPGNMNPNYGVAVLYENNGTSLLYIVPFTSLLDYLDSQNITMYHHKFGENNLKIGVFALVDDINLEGLMENIFRKSSGEWPHQK